MGFEIPYNEAEINAASNSIIKNQKVEKDSLFGNQGLDHYYPTFSKLLLKPCHSPLFTQSWPPNTA